MLHKQSNLNPSAAIVDNPHHPTPPTHNLPPQTQQHTQTTCYVIQTRDIPGKFDAKRAKSLGLKPGPLFRKLTEGESVTTCDGLVVTPEQCISPSKKGPIVIVLECPTLAHAQSLFRSQFLRKYRDGDRDADRDGCYNADRHVVTLVTHMTPHHILMREDYQRWIDGFGESCRHVVMNEVSCRKISFQNDKFAFFSQFFFFHNN